MFIDTSAFVAILRGETESKAFLVAIKESKNPRTSPIVRLETVIVIATRKGLAIDQAEQLFDALASSLGIAVTSLTDEMGRAACDAFARFGKGRGHPAQLNLADCLSYGAAKVMQTSLLFKGDDFAKTDIAVAAF
jgi:ribonuclease VapC